jgi:hypothetical protein
MTTEITVRAYPPPMVVGAVVTGVEMVETTDVVGGISTVVDVSVVAGWVSVVVEACVVEAVVSLVAGGVLGGVGEE